VKSQKKLGKLTRSSKQVQQKRNTPSNKRENFADEDSLAA
jgi:hypothetical protein